MGIFKVGQKVFLCSPNLVEQTINEARGEHIECLFTEGEIRSLDEDVSEYYWMNDYKQGCWVEKYIFSTKEEAQKAGKSFLKEYLEYVKKNHKSKVKYLTSLLT